MKKVLLPLLACCLLYSFALFFFSSPALADDWQVEIGTNPNSVEIDKNGNSYLAGFRSVFKHDSEGNYLWEKSYSTLLPTITSMDVSQLVGCNDGSFFLVVETSDANYNLQDIRMAGFDADGQSTSFPITTLPNSFSRAAAFRGDANDNNKGVVTVSSNLVTEDITYTDQSGNQTTITDVTYTPSVALTRYNGATGATFFNNVQLTAAQLGKDGASIAVEGVRVSSDQSFFYLAGTLSDPTASESSRYPQNIVVAKINASDGSLAWSRRVGPEQWPSSGDYWVPYEVTSLSIDPDNRAHVTGQDWHYNSPYVSPDHIYLRVTADNTLERQEEPSSIGSELMEAGADGFFYGFGRGSAPDLTGDATLTDTGGYISKYDLVASALARIGLAPVGREADAYPFGARIDSEGNNYIWGYNYHTNVSFIQKNPFAAPILGVSGVLDANTPITVETGPNVDPATLEGKVVYEFALTNNTGGEVTIKSLTFKSSGRGIESQAIGRVQLLDGGGNNLIPVFTAGAEQHTFDVSSNLADSSSAIWQLVYDVNQDACTYVGDSYFKVMLDSLTAEDAAGEPVNVKITNPEGPQLVIPEGTFAIDPATSGNSTTEPQEGQTQTLNPPLAALVEGQSNDATCGVRVVFDITTEPRNDTKLSTYQVTMNGGERAESSVIFGGAGVYQIKAYLKNPKIYEHPITGGTVGGEPTYIPLKSVPAGITVPTGSPEVSFTATAMGVQLAAQHDGDAEKFMVSTFIRNILADNEFTATVIPDDQATGVNFDLNGQQIAGAVSSGTYTATFDMAQLNSGLANSLTATATLSGGGTLQKIFKLQAIDYPSWVQPLMSITNNWTEEFQDSSERYHIGFSYPVDFVWNNTIAGSILLLGGKENSSNLNFNADAFYNINRTAMLTAKGTLASTILGWDFDANGDLTGDFDENFSLIEGRGNVHTTVPFTIPEKGVSKDILVYGVPVTLAIDVGGEGKVLLAGSAMLDSNLKFKKILIHPGVEVELDATASVAAFYGAAKLGVNARPLTELEVKILYVSVSGIDPSLGGRITIPVKVIGSLFWGTVNGTLASTTLGPYGFGTMAAAVNNRYPYSTPYTTGAAGSEIPEFIATGDIAMSGERIMLVMTADTDTAEGVISPDIFYRYFDGVDWQALAPLALETDLWEMDPAVTFMGDSAALALWTSNDGDKTLDDLNDIFAHQDIRYSVWDGTTWATTAWLTDDLQTDGMVDVSYNGADDEAIAVWFHDNNTDNDQESRESWEIRAATYDPGTASWSTPANISGVDAEADYMPRIASGGSKNMAVWARDTDGSFITTLSQVTDGTNVSYDNADGSVYYAVYENVQWGAAVMIPGSQRGFVSFPTVAITADGSKAIVAWVAKENGATAGSVLCSLYYAVYTFADESWTTPVVVRSGSGMEELQVLMGNGNVATLLWRTTGPEQNGHLSQTTIDLASGAIGVESRLTYGPQVDWGVTAAMDDSGDIHGMWQQLGPQSSLAPAGGGYEAMQSGIFNAHNGVINGVSGEDLIDQDGDGLTDILRVNVDLDITAAGDFTLIGTLVDSNGQQVTTAATYLPGMTAATYSIFLDFDGSAISAHNVDGPYTVSEIVLLENSNGSLVADIWSDGWTTALLPVSDFALGFVGVLAGDVDGDLELSLSDAILAQQILSTAEDTSSLQVRPYYAESGTDINGDGRVGFAEAIYVLRELAGLRDNGQAAAQ